MSSENPEGKYLPNNGGEKERTTLWQGAENKRKGSKGQLWAIR